MIDELIKKLMEKTDTFLFIEYYSHADALCYKILNPHTEYREHKIVLCKVSDGIEKALKEAIIFFDKEIK